jgi:ElaB/YqjD/DUF883 family membrane-anchored ribosome-binding protein
VLRWGRDRKELTMNTPSELPSPTLTNRIDSLVSNLKNAAEHLSSAASSFKGRAAEARSHATARASSIAARAGKLIKDHPTAAIGFALGTGYLLVRLLRR